MTEKFHLRVDVHAAYKKQSVKLPDELKEFLSHVTYPIDEKAIAIRDNKAYVISDYMPDEKGLRIMRNGTLLGEIKKNRFEPSQAFAMVLKMSEYDKIIKKLETFASSTMGKALCKDLLPSSDYEEILSAQTETKDALTRLYKTGYLSFQGLSDIRPHLRLLEISCGMEMDVDGNYTTG